MFRTVHIITTSNVDVMANEALEISDNIKIYKSDTKDFRSVIKTGNHLSMKSKKSFLYKQFYKLKKTLPFHFYLDEGGQAYIKNATRIAEEIIGSNKISHLYSSFMPYADHKIASLIKAKHKDLKWYADFRDLQVEPEYKNVYFENWNLRQERRIVKSAEKVSTISKGLAKHLDRIHDRVISLARGVEMHEESENIGDEFTFVYTGSLFYDFRDGGSVVEQIAEFIKEGNISPDTFQFEYAGREGEIWERWFEEIGIRGYFRNRGFIARKEAVELQKKANLLLLLTSSSEEHQGVLTGKLFEYLETGRPIMNYINGIQDREFEELFERTDAGAIFYKKNLFSLKERLGFYYNLWLNKETPKVSKKGLEERKLMSWENRAKELLSE